MRTPGSNVRDIRATRVLATLVFTGGDFSGDCADLGGCSLDNNCCEDPMACGTMCLPFLTTDCSDCLAALSDCLTAECGTECDTGGVDIPPGGDPTGACADLADCCAALPDEAGAACDPIVAANQGELCTTALEAFQMGGQCP